MRRIIWSLLLCFCCAGLLSKQACSPPTVCAEGSIGSQTLDPYSSPCEKRCECNNQRYTGNCIKEEGAQKGVCFAAKREACETKGAKRNCTIDARMRLGCLNGAQTCQPDGLDGKFWGDCECKACIPGTREPCYDGPDNTLNKGACKGGIRVCSQDGKWGECVGQSLPRQEECNQKDDDCNGLVDDACGQERVLPDGGAPEMVPEPTKTRCQFMGTNNDGCSCFSGGERICETLPCQAKQRCEGGTWGGCIPDKGSVGDSCDGVDNNCDGRIDEGQTGCATVFAGRLWGDGENGYLTNAFLKLPTKIAISTAGVMYIVDTGQAKVLRVGPSGNVVLFAGEKQGAGPGVFVKFARPVGVAVDKDENVYVVDEGEFSPVPDSNGRVVKIAPNGQVTELVKTGTLKGPRGIAVDSKRNVYIVDTGNHRIQKWTPDGKLTTFAGGTKGSADGQGSSATFFQPVGIAIDQDDNVYIADTGNHRIRKIAPNGQVTTIAGLFSGLRDGHIQDAASNQKGPLFSSPSGLAVDGAGNVYVSDTGNHALRKIDKEGNVTTIAGVSKGTTFRTGVAGYLDGDSKQALLRSPQDVAIGPDKNLYIADTQNQLIRKLSFLKMDVTTAVGRIHGKVGVRERTEFSVLGIFAKDGVLYATDRLRHRILKINTKEEANTPSYVTVIAGGERGNKDGHGTSARFNEPYNVVQGADGALYVSDTLNHTIRKIDKNGNVDIIAGGESGYKDGHGLNAKFNSPKGLAIDSAGNLYVADTGNHRIRKIDKGNNVTTVAGGLPGCKDGKGQAAHFLRPDDLTVDSAGNLYVADTGNHVVRKISPQGDVTMLAGSCKQSGFAQGVGAAARLDQPGAIAVNAKGEIFVAEHGNYSIRKISPQGRVTLYAGGGFSGTVGQSGTEVSTLLASFFEGPTDLVFDQNGVLYIADGRRVRMIRPTK